MNLQAMLDVQRRLQIETYGHDPIEMEGDERAQYVRDMVLACEDELHEALNEMGWKPWATSRHFNRDAYVNELVDAWHFFMNLMLVGQVTADEFVAAYAEKHARNVTRQEEGYDGVAGKCPKCHRALDDKGVQCDGKMWCGVYGELARPGPPP